MWAAGYGPKALQLIGELADGFILQTADPAVTHWVVETVARPPWPRARPEIGHDVRRRARLRG